MNLPKSRFQHTVGHLSNTIFKLVSVQAQLGTQTHRTITSSNDIKSSEAPAHGQEVTIRLRYSPSTFNWT